MPTTKSAEFRNDLVQCYQLVLLKEKEILIEEHLPALEHITDRKIVFTILFFNTIRYTVK